MRNSLPSPNKRLANLAARARIEGRDEVAALASGFNESAARIEQLVRAHQTLLANCSHELRTRWREFAWPSSAYPATRMPSLR